MCEATTISLISLGLAAAGGTASYMSSQQQQNAMANAQLDETRRQGDVMRDQMRLQEQQRQDAENSRKAFQNETLDAYTKDQMDSDVATGQTGIAQALQAAGARAAIPASVADATSQSGAVNVSSDPAMGGTSAYGDAFAKAMQQAGSMNQQQAGAQAALMALSNARRLGADRLQQSAQNIQLANARTAALNRPQGALGLLSSASRQRYAADAGEAQNKGAGLALLGAGLSTLGSMGYSYGSSGGNFKKQQSTTTP